MKLIPFLAFLLCMFPLSLSAQSDAFSFPEWTQSEIDAANTAKSVTYLSEPEKEMVLLTNLVRMNPQKFSKTYLEKYLSDYSIDKNNSYVTSLKRELATLSPMNPLKPSKKLSSSAAFHADDMGKTGLIGHDDSNGTSMEKRFYRYIPKEKVRALSENCHYGFKEPFRIFMDLLIDEGIEDLGHRINVLDSDMEFTGVAIRPHTKYRVNCVQDFGAVMR